jgi:PRTRC genetic system protein E
MFNDLLALLEKRSLVLTLSALAEKRIRVTVTPRPKSDEDKKLAVVPLVVEGTAAELDEGFAKALQSAWSLR